MKDKGIIFSITALNFVALFILFLSIYVFLVDDIEFIDSVESLYYRTKNLFYESEPNQNYNNVGWCVQHLKYNPESSNLTDQSILIVEKYCENYAK